MKTSWKPLGRRDLIKLVRPSQGFWAAGEMAFSGVTGDKRTNFEGNVKTKDNISEQGTQENTFSILGEH